MGPADLLVITIYVSNARSMFQFALFHKKRKKTLLSYAISEYFYNSYKIPLLTQIGCQLLIQMKMRRDNK
jgi:hypothetical protein